MSLRVSTFTSADASRWDQFVRDSRNGNFFHTRAFLSYHPSDRFTDASVWVMDGEKPRAVLPAAEREVDGKRMLVAHPGASYGGAVFAADVGVQESGQILAALTDHARAQKFAGMQFLRLPPTSIRKEFSEDQEYWMYQNGWRCTRMEMDGAIDLCGATEENALSLLTGKCRNMVRQAERAGITVRETDDFSSFWRILNATLSRHKVTPTHTIEEILRLKNACPKDVRLFGAFLDQTLVGGIVVMTLHENALYTLYMAQDYEHQSAHPIHAVLTDVIRTTIREDRRILHLGVSTEDGGKSINEGLFFFKESFHCRPVRRESWELYF